MIILFKDLVNFCRPSYKNWDKESIYEDLWEAFLRNELICLFNKESILEGVLVYKTNYLGEPHISQIVTNKIKGKAKKLVRLLMNRYPYINYASSLKRGKIIVHERKRLDKHF